MGSRWLSLVVLLGLSLASSVLLRGAQPSSPVTLALGDTTRLAASRGRAHRHRGTQQADRGTGRRRGPLALGAPAAHRRSGGHRPRSPTARCIATSSTRNNMPLDIRQHQDWMATVHTLRSTADLRAFYRRVMAPANSEKNTWITDLNQDGSRDIRDMQEYKERIFRLRDTDGDGRADESRLVFEGFNDDPAFDILGGILAHDGGLDRGRPARASTGCRTATATACSISARLSARASTPIPRSAAMGCRASRSAPTGVSTGKWATSACTWWTRPAGRGAYRTRAR